MNEKFRIVTWAYVVVIALFVALVFSQANKKFALDEVDFPVLAKAISETGTPFHYRGETDPRSLGLWHPPLYANSLAAFVKVFGFNENTVRAFGMFCTLLSAFLCILIYSELFNVKGLEKDRISLIFLSLFLLHPYTIANTTVPDIDSTVLPVTILVFVYGLIRLLNLGGVSVQSLWPVKGGIILSVLFALNLWAKLTTPLVLIPVAFLIFLIKGWPLKRAAAVSFAVAVLGGLVFLATYALYCYVLSLPFDFTFRFLMFSFTKNSASGGGISALVAGVTSHLSYSKQFVNWLSLIFVFTFTLSCCHLVFQKVKSQSETILLVLAGFGLFVTMFYLSLTGAFGGFFKYPYPIFPLLVLVVAHFINRHLPVTHMGRDVTWNERQDTTAKFGFDRLWLILFVSVAVVACYYQSFVTKDIVTLEDHPVAFGVILAIMLIAASTSVFAAKKPASLLLRYGLAILFAVLVGTQFGISRSQAVAAYPTKYHYGQIGFEETVSYLKERIGQNEPVWSMKDIGHYANGTYIENYSSLFKTQPEITQNLQRVINNKGVRYFVVTTGVGQDRVDAYAELKSALDTCCVIDKKFGNFIIYKAKQHE